MEKSQQKKNIFDDDNSISVGIPFALRFSLIWTLFFIIIGIAIQSIQSGQFIFSNFFTSNYLTWFRGLGDFVNTTQYASVGALIKAIFSQWYYFFYTGGIVSLIWIAISILINKEFKIKK